MYVKYNMSFNMYRGIYVSLCIYIISAAKSVWQLPGFMSDTYEGRDDSSCTSETQSA